MFAAPLEFFAAHHLPDTDLEHAIELTKDFAYVKNIRRQRTPEQYDFIESKVKQV
jgi:hypothetical protein